ncbi:hypothetical protein HID58_026612 [Brassica napus]|uniref:Uncharacterized protein n=1 Tax=Brassica napus TaxID=3708 RepID=A0ABQ8CQ44_BRANA|nr:hypothetical protein HID58_026612 [Brassica napus]
MLRPTLKKGVSFKLCLLYCRGDLDFRIDNGEAAAGMMMGHNEMGESSGQAMIEQDDENHNEIGEHSVWSPHLQNEHDKIQELMQQLAAEKKRAATYKRHLEMLFEHIEQHNEGLTKRIQHIVDNVRDLEQRDHQQNQA